MADLALCLAEGRTPAEGAYFSRGIREPVTILEKRGAARAVEMLVASLRGEPVNTELPLPSFEKVPPAPPLEDLSRATIVWAHEGGLTRVGNPDRIEMAMATRFGRYPLAGLEKLDPGSLHRGPRRYDNAHAKANPNRLVPLDALRALAATGMVGAVGEWFLCHGRKRHLCRKCRRVRSGHSPRHPQNLPGQGGRSPPHEGPALVAAQRW